MDVRADHAKYGFRKTHLQSEYQFGRALDKLFTLFAQEHHEKGDELISVHRRSLADALVTALNDHFQDDITYRWGGHENDVERGLMIKQACLKAAINHALFQPRAYKTAYTVANAASSFLVSGSTPTFQSESQKILSKALTELNQRQASEAALRPA